MFEPEITVTGNVGADPTARTTPNGVPVTDLRVAVSPRRRVKGTEEWTDLPTVWFQVSAWGRLGQNVASSVRKGDRVVVSGTLSVATWTTKEGEPRTSLEINASQLGLELSRGTAVSTRPPLLVADRDPGPRPDDDPAGETPDGEQGSPDWAVAPHDPGGGEEVAA